MLAYLWIAIGGALGSVARFWFSGVVGRRFGETFPWGTLLVNVSGSFAIGLLAALAEPGGRRFISPTGRQFLMYGVCGGYTTFSSFSLQTLELLRDGDWVKAGANAAGSVVLCLVAVWLGYALGAGFSAGKGT
jgi:CrcB protein